MAHDLPPIALYRRIAVGLLVSVGVVFLSILYIAMVRATISITLKKQSFPLNQSFAVSSRVPAPTASSTTIPGQVTVVERSATREVAATSLTLQEGKAEGVVTITNRTTRAQPLVPTTRLLSPQGVLFRTTEFVTVPGGGAVDVHVVADQPGSAGDIGPTTFILPGLWKGAQEQITGANAKPMSGGKKTATSLSAESQKDVEEQESAAIKEAVLNEYRSKLANASDVVIAAVSRKSSTIEPATPATVRVVVKTSIVVAQFNPQPLEEPLKASLSQAIPSPYVFGGLDQSKAFEYTLKQFDAKSKTAQFVIHAFAWAAVSGDALPISKDQFLGMRVSDVSAFAANIKDIESIHVQTSPFWLRTIPKRADRVTLDVVSPTE
ncbi:hypothetical protein HZA86_05540 [Candidatus Uhrbacteria bacterium]|nr:hypothetical protein [Candidatus Uhrbacteria bacterium]